MISVRFSGMEQCKQDLLSQRDQLAVCKASLLQIYRSLPRTIHIETNVGSNLYNLAERLEKLAHRVTAYSDGLAEITALYGRTENALCGRTPINNINNLWDIVPVPIQLPRPFRPGGSGFTLPRWSQMLLLGTPLELLTLGASGTRWSLSAFNHNVGDNKASGSVLELNRTTTGKLFGLDAERSITDRVLGYEAGVKGKAEWDLKEGEFGVSGQAEASGYLYQREEEARLGMLSGSSKLNIGKVGVSGAIGATLMQDGKFMPSLFVKGKAKASVLEGEAKGQFGDDQNNVHGKLSGTLLGAEAKAEGGVGLVSFEKSDGTEVSGFGIGGKVGAEAYVAEGKASGGFSIFGIKVDATVSGKAGGAGVKAGGAITTGGVEGEIGAGLGLGAGLKVSVDWTNFKPPKIELPKIKWPFG